MQQPVLELQEESKRAPILVQRNQDVDQVVRQIQQNNFDGRNNIANIVETLLVQNGFNMGLHRPNFVSALSDYVLMLSICIGCIVAKTNIHVCVVGYYVPTCLRHICKMLDTMFQHPGTVQCALHHACYVRAPNPLYLILANMQTLIP